MCVKNRVKEMRWKKNFSQEQLARIADVKKNVISYLEKHEEAVTDTQNAVKLAKALDVPISELFPD